MKILEMFLSIQTIAKVLDVHPDTIRKEIKTGRLKAKRVGVQFRISESNFNAYCNSNDKPQINHARTRKYNRKTREDPDYIRI